MLAWDKARIALKSRPWVDRTWWWSRAYDRMTRSVERGSPLADQCPVGQPCFLNHSTQAGERSMSTELQAEYLRAPGAGVAPQARILVLALSGSSRLGSSRCYGGTAFACAGVAQPSLAEQSGKPRLSEGPFDSLAFARGSLRGLDCHERA